MKKKVLSVLLAMCLLMGCLPMAASAEGETSGVCGESAVWNYEKDTKTLVISGTGKIDDYYSGSGCFLGVLSDRPWKAFQTEIEHLRVEQGITYIGSHTFYQLTGLRDAVIADSVRYTGTHVFSGCQSLKDVTLSKRLDGLSICFFGDCTSLTSIVLPENVSTIGGNAFSGCTNLRDISFPEGLTTIVGFAFEGCSSLTAVTLPDGVTRLYPGAFYDCGGLTSIVIPHSITCIERNTFAKCENLTSVTIPDSVLRIDAHAFSGCSKLTSITIPASVAAFKTGVFNGCTDLIIYGEEGSAAETYANENNIPFNVEREPAPAPEPTPAPTPVPAAPAEPEPDPAPEPPARFTDVPDGSSFADAVKWAVENNIASGTDETHFSPNASCTRAQAVTFLWRAAGEPEPAGDAAFADVKNGSYYEKAVRWAVGKGITSGTGNGKFSPNDPCTRAEIAAFLWRAAGKPGPAETGEGFHDVSAGAYYENAVKWAAEQGITSGTGGSKFSPDDTCVRGQIVTFLYRYSR